MALVGQTPSLTQSFRMVSQPMRLASEAAKRSAARIRAAGEQESSTSAAGDGASTVVVERQAVPGAARSRGNSPRVTSASAALAAGDKYRHGSEIELELDFSGESDKETDSHATPPASG